MQSLFGRAAALLSKRPAPAADSTCLEKMVARQKAAKAAGAVDRLWQPEVEQATAPLYGPSAYRSLEATDLR